MFNFRKLVQIWTATALALAAVSSGAFADDRMAKNVITVGTGHVPNDNDPRIQQVARQLERIQGFCNQSSHGADIGDKIAYSQSQLKTPQPLFAMLDGFETIAASQCGRYADSMLLGLYVLERNEGVSHSQAVRSIATRPAPLIKKWQSRPSR